MKKYTLLIAVLLLAGCAQQPAQTPAEPTQTSQETQASTEASTAAKEAPSQENAVVFSAESGFYDHNFSLEMTAPEGAVIHYTTDGSIPDASSEVYTEPLKMSDRSGDKNKLSANKGISLSSDFVPQKFIKKANVIRAVAEYPDGSLSEVCNRTYFVNVHEYPVPVISLKTAESNLFDYDTGIYVLGSTYEKWAAEQTEHYEGWQAEGNYSNRGREWERPVDFEWIGTDGTVFDQECGMRIMGAASRTALQKSFRIIAREEYGNKNFKFPLIPGNMRSDGTGEVKKYRSFIIRNGGNDCDYAKFRDPMIQKLASCGDFETMQYQPVVVFIDGEYWGLYTLAEDYSSHYIENNYGTKDENDVFDDNNIVIVKKNEIEDGKDEDLALYNDMFDFITSNDMREQANYEKAASMMDMHSYADYLALLLYTYNRDAYYDGNNWAMWRVRQTGSEEKADGLWRMMLFDTEFSSGLYNDGTDYHDNNIKEVLGRTPSDTDDDGEPYRDPLFLMLSLVENHDFKNELINSMCDMRNICFEKDRVLNEISEFYEVYSPLAPDTFERFGPDWVLGWDPAGYYGFQSDVVATFFNGRYDVFPDLVEDALECGEQAHIHISYDDTKGTVYVNDKPVPKEFDGIYFANVPIRISGKSSEGNAVFECDGCTEENGQFILTKEQTVKVTFE